MLYTGRGDDGTSSLFDGPERSPKDGPVFEALGALDECNSFVGLCYAKAGAEDAEQAGYLRAAQENLFIIQAQLAGARKELPQGALAELEGHIAEIGRRFSHPHAFVIPGSTERSAYCDVARAVCRRAERRVVAARRARPLPDMSIAYLNRLSSLLYALARYFAKDSAVKEQSPSY